MDESEELEIHAAVDAALNDLAERLGGTSDTGGPVENATQIKGRGDLGVLLTDADNRVLGRVWIAFGAALDLADGTAIFGSRAGPPASTTSGEGGNVRVQAEVCSEILESPVSVEAWAAAH